MTKHTSIRTEGGRGGVRNDRTNMHGDGGEEGRVRNDKTYKHQDGGKG